jgi:type I restriction enzyme S subunit
MPKLRFPEFLGAGDWTTEKLGAVATISTEKVGNNICVPMSITSGVGLISQQDKFGRVIAGDSYKNYLLLKPNEFAYNKSATKDYPEGFLTLYSGAELAAVPNSIFTCFRVNGVSPDVRFLNYQFSDNLHGRWLRQFIQVGARAHGSLSINDNDLMALPVPIPAGTTSVAEQQKIAECLSSLDELMAAQARKVDALKTHKKGLMRQLFPRDGETHPRLRFPEFRNAEEWEARSFGSLCESISSGKDKAAAEGAFDLYGSTGVIGKTQQRSYGGNYLLVARVGANAGFVTKATGEFGVTDNTLVITLKAQQQVDFFRYYLDCVELNKMVFGSGQPLITGGQIKALGLHLPPLAEQHCIAWCLSSLDALITAETQKLEALKTHKKGLMQQLFPSPEAAEA